MEDSNDKVQWTLVAQGPKGHVVKKYCSFDHEVESLRPKQKYLIESLNASQVALLGLPTSQVLLHNVDNAQLALLLAHIEQQRPFAHENPQA